MTQEEYIQWFNSLTPEEALAVARAKENQPIERFPLSLDCICKQNLKIQYRKEQYLGGKKNEWIEIDFTIIFRNSEEVTLFREWYFKKIKDGSLSFLVTLSLFGELKAYIAVFSNNLNYSDFTGNTRRMLCKIKIKNFKEV